MKKIYLNSDLECSAMEKSDTVLTVETDVFSGKCNEYIEGYHFVPVGKSRVREDGGVFKGEYAKDILLTFAKMAKLDETQIVDSILDNINNNKINDVPKLSVY